MNDSKRWFSEKVNRINKPLATLIKKNNRTYINKIRKRSYT